MHKAARKMLLMGLGALSLTREKVEQLVDELVKKGEMDNVEAKGFTDELLRRGEKEREMLKKIITDEINKLKNEIGMAKKEELENLKKRIERLEEELETRNFKQEI